MVEKYARQIGSSPQVGAKMKNIKINNNLPYNPTTNHWIRMATYNILAKQAPARPVTW